MLDTPTSAHSPATVGHPFAIVLAAASLLAQSHVAAAVVPLGPDFAPKGEVRLASRSASDPVTTTASFNHGSAASQAANFNAVLGEGDHTIQMQWGA